MQCVWSNAVFTRTPGNISLTRLNLRWLRTMQPDVIDDQFSHLRSLGFGGFSRSAQPDNGDLFDPADDWDRPGYFRHVRRGALCAGVVHSAGIRAVAHGFAARPGAPARGAAGPATAPQPLGELNYPPK